MFRYCSDELQLQRMLYPVLFNVSVTFNFCLVHPLTNRKRLFLVISYILNTVQTMENP